MSHPTPPHHTIANRYQLGESLGRGSFGRTVRACDLVAQRDVAVKVLDKRDDVDLKTLELFEREAAVLRTLRHHGVPEIFDLVTDEWNGAKTSFLVMELVEGRALLDLIAAGDSLDSQQTMHLFLEMLNILEYLHGRVPPVVHRDIKPANIIVRPDGTPALVDFGSVRRVFLAGDESGSTIVGTYGYMPYEQYMGQATPASDLYSLAATFLHVLTGRPPREFMKGEGRIEVPDNLPGDARLRPILMQLLKPSPAERIASAKDVRAALLAPTAVGLYRSSTHTAVRNALDLSALGETPRQRNGELKKLEKRLSPSWLEWMDSGAKPGDASSLLDWASLAFFSTVTFGVLPIVFLGRARQRQTRVRRFLSEGVPCVAEVREVSEEKIEFEAKVGRVAYQFEADGEMHSDVDKVLLYAAHKWRPGDRIQILYIPHEDYDSIIVSGR